MSHLKDHGPGWLRPLIEECVDATPPDLVWLLRDLGSSSPGYGIIRSAGSGGAEGALAEKSLYSTLQAVANGKEGVQLELFSSSFSSPPSFPLPPARHAFFFLQTRP